MHAAADPADPPADQPADPAVDPAADPGAGWAARWAADWAARWAPDAVPEVLAERCDVLVLARGEVVVKVHHAATDAGGLARRLAFAADGTAREALLAPLLPVPERAGGRLLSVWPRAEVLRPDDLDDAPWGRLGWLAATLHRVEAPTVPLPPTRAPDRVGEALARLEAASAVRPGHGEARGIVLAAASTLPPSLRTPASAVPVAGHVVHGDLHLGQLARRPGPGGDDWRLLDVDDLGLGDPAWDLARPAAWVAAGVLDPADWTAFLQGYRAAGGPAVPPDGDPWPALDAVARALAVQTAARAVLEAIREDRELDPVAGSFVRTSAAIVEDADAAPAASRPTAC